LALINDDLDVPVDVGTFNQAGEVVSRLQERRALCHWVLVNLAPDDREIGLGEFSNGVAVGGKPGPDGPRGTLQGLNEYTDWFINDPVMAGKYFGYDGPCPPYNDEVAHRYVFTLYALDAARLQVDTVFDKHGALREISNHILASASITGTFSSNRSVRPRSG
jgi:Raf kinase inhibitor-like YbhB/YbcL family protein